MKLTYFLKAPLTLRLRQSIENFHWRSEWLWFDCCMIWCLIPLTYNQCSKLTTVNIFQSKWGMCVINFIWNLFFLPNTLTSFDSINVLFLNRSTIADLSHFWATNEIKLGKNLRFKLSPSQKVAETCLVIEILFWVGNKCISYYAGFLHSFWLTIWDIKPGKKCALGYYTTWDCRNLLGHQNSFHVWKVREKFVLVSINRARSVSIPINFSQIFCETSVQHLQMKCGSSQFRHFEMQFQDISKELLTQVLMFPWFSNNLSLQFIKNWLPTLWLAIKND